MKTTITAKLKTYRIENTYGMSGGRWSGVCATRDAAAQTLRLAMGWDEIWLSKPFNDCDGTSWCVYESEKDLDADGDGARAPRIVEVCS